MKASKRSLFLILLPLSALLLLLIFPRGNKTKEPNFTALATKKKAEKLHKENRARKKQRKRAEEQKNTERVPIKKRKHLNFKISTSEWFANDKHRFLSQAKLLAVKKLPGRGKGYTILFESPLNKGLISEKPTRHLLEFSFQIPGSIPPPTHLWILDSKVYSPMVEIRTSDHESFFSETIPAKLGSRPDILFSCPGHQVTNLRFRILPPLFKGDRDLTYWKAMSNRFTVPFALNPGAWYSLSDLRGNFQLQPGKGSFIGRNPAWKVPLIPVAEFLVQLYDASTQKPISGWSLKIKTRKGQTFGSDYPSGKDGVCRFTFNKGKKGKQIAWLGLQANYYATTKEGFSLFLGKRVLARKDEPDRFNIPALGSLNLIYKKEDGRIKFPSALRIQMKALTGPCANQAREFFIATRSPNTEIPFIPKGIWKINISTLRNTLFLSFPKRVQIFPGSPTILPVNILKPWVLRVSFLGGSSKPFPLGDLKLLQSKGSRISQDADTGTIQYASMSEFSFFQRPGGKSKFPQLVSQPFRFDQDQKAYLFFVPAKKSHLSLLLFSRKKPLPRTYIFPSLSVSKDQEHKFLTLPETGTLSLALSPRVPKGMPLFLIFKREDGLILPSHSDYAFKGVPISSKSTLSLPDFPVGLWEVGVKSGPSSLIGMMPNASFRIQAGKETKFHLDFYSQKWMPLKGLALNQRGEPIRLQNILFFRSSNQYWVGERILYVKTDEDGLFSLPFLPPGRYVLGAFSGTTGKIRYAPVPLIHPQLRAPSRQPFTFIATDGILFTSPANKPIQGIRCHIKVGGKLFFSAISDSHGRAFRETPPVAFKLYYHTTNGLKSMDIPDFTKRPKPLKITIGK
ncbi:MAG TPA: carboxypeptidase regulatory-like domain-containing protein [Planctomycetes bacterium]|nr:carboxypeptidase regulatory-like domain-containing protein [Planctomycetota bacterium]